MRETGTEGVTLDERKLMDEMSRSIRVKIPISS